MKKYTAYTYFYTKNGERVYLDPFHVKANSFKEAEIKIHEENPLLNIHMIK